MMLESNFHLPRCVYHLECFMDTLSNHQDWILKGMDTLDSLHPIVLRWKTEQFSSTKSEFANDNPNKLPKDVCPQCQFSTKNKECHVQVFAKYCKAQVNKVFIKYSKAMEPMMVKKIYCIIYNSVLYYYNYSCFNIMTFMTLHLPPKCLSNEMVEYMDDIACKCSDYIELLLLACLAVHSVSRCPQKTCIRREELLKNITYRGRFKRHSLSQNNV